MNSGIFISYRYNVKEMDDGIEAFQCELSQNYLCQGIGKWIPACSEGVKMWMTMFLTVPIGQFLAECLKDVAKETVIIAAEKHPSNGECCLDAWRFEENKLFESNWIITYADNRKTL